MDNLKFHFQEKKVTLDYPWRSLAERFINNLDRKPTTKETYRKSINEWIKFFDNANRNPDINIILQYKRYLIKKGLSPYSISVYLTALRVFFDYLVSFRIIPFNPAKSIKSLKKPKSKRDALTKEEALRLISLNSLNTIEDYRNKAILMLKLFTGLRDISIVNADVKDLKVKEDKYLLYYLNKGSDSKDSFVIVNNSAYRDINAYLVKRTDLGPNRPLFVSNSDRNRGSRLTTQSIRLIIKSLLKKVGIVRPEIKPHSLRHSAITFSILGGAKVTQAKEMANHSNISTTASYYHDLNRLKNPAESYIDKFLYDDDR